MKSLWLQQNYKCIYCTSVFTSPILKLNIIVVVVIYIFSSESKMVFSSIKCFISLHVFIRRKLLLSNYEMHVFLHNRLKCKRKIFLKAQNNNKSYLQGAPTAMFAFALCGLLLSTSLPDWQSSEYQRKSSTTASSMHLSCSGGFGRRERCWFGIYVLSTLAFPFSY